MKRGMRRRRLVRALVSLALLAGMVEAGQVTVTPHAVADASTGSAGMFVAATGRLLDTRNGTGGFSTPMPAGTVRTVTAAGAAGIPTTGVSALALTLTVVGAGTIGSISVGPGDASTAPTGGALVFNPGDSVSNSDLVALHSDGTLHVVADHSVNLIIDVQGYFTSGSTTAAGGFVPVDQTRIADTRSGSNVPQAQVASGASVTVQASGLAGIPSGASSVYVNITVLSPASNGYLRTFAAGGTTPTTGALDFDNVTTAQSVAVPLSADGKFTVLVGAGGPVDLLVDVEGYYTASPQSGAFTPAAVHLLDTRAAPVRTLPANSVSTFTVAGVAGIPSYVDGVTAVALNVRTVQAASNTTAGGYLRLWASDEDEPSTSSVNYTATNVYRSNLVIVTPGADGTISVRNGGSGAVDLVIDVEGWYSSGPLGPHISSTSVHAMEWISPTASIPMHFVSSSVAAPVTSYTYQYDDQPGGSVSGASGDMSVPALSEGHHSFSVTAVDALGLQSPAETFDFYVGGVTSPVQAVAVQPANGSATVTWSAPSTLGGSAAADVTYNVAVLNVATGDYVVGGGCTGDCSSWVVPGLAPATSYVALVSTHTGAGDSSIVSSASFEPASSGAAAACTATTCATWAPGSTDLCASASTALSDNWACDENIRTEDSTDPSGNPVVTAEDVTNGATANVTGMSTDEAEATLATAEQNAPTASQAPQESSYQASYDVDTVVPAATASAARYQSKRNELIIWHINGHTGHTNFYHGLNIQFHSVDVTMRFGTPSGEAVSLTWDERLRHDKAFEPDTTLNEFGFFGSSIPSSPARMYYIEGYAGGYRVLPFAKWTVFFDAYNLYLRWSGTGLGIIGSVQSERIKCFKTVSCKF